MNPKLEKYTIEKERNERRIEALRARNEKLDKLIAELQSLELNSLLRGAKMSYQDLTAYIQSKAGQNAPLDLYQEESHAHEKTKANGQAPAHGNTTAQEEAPEEERA